ncbi:polysaccharide deacetylase family protein [Paenibacillus sp. NFR01]|uniref:polysaccharide deacetylase family protein n=1 Tax=Paenibacillus sp. NFR01 TaxID=1566279 RepID=UPI001114540F|nr:polysaccharide deacetylase family protein [Paenibacillus sp. NFR01]
MYHYVQVPGLKGIHPLHPDLFEKQLDWVLQNYEVVVPDDLEKPRQSKPRCVITFDDATKDQYEIAFPILKSRGIPAYFTFMSGIFTNRKVPVVHLVHAALSFFTDEEIWEEICSKFDTSQVKENSQIYSYEPDIYRRYNKYALNFYLSEEESRSVLEPKLIEKFQTWDRFIESYYINLDEWKVINHAGMSIGVHAVDHKPYCGVAERFFANEIKPCKQFIQEHLGFSPKWYTPAFGGGTLYQDMILKLRPVLEKEGFAGGFTTLAGFNDENNRFWLNRFDCNRIPPVGNFE